MIDTAIGTGFPSHLATGSVPQDRLVQILCRGCSSSMINSEHIKPIVIPGQKSQRVLFDSEVLEAVRCRAHSVVEVLAWCISIDLPDYSDIRGESRSCNDPSAAEVATCCKRL